MFRYSNQTSNQIRSHFGSSVGSCRLPAPMTMPVPMLITLRPAAVRQLCRRRERNAVRALRWRAARAGAPVLPVVLARQATQYEESQVSEFERPDGEQSMAELQASSPDSSWAHTPAKLRFASRSPSLAARLPKVRFSEASTALPSPGSVCGTSPAASACTSVDSPAALELHSPVLRRPSSASRLPRMSVARLSCVPVLFSWARVEVADFTHGTRRDENADTTPGTTAGATAGTTADDGAGAVRYVDASEAQNFVQNADASTRDADASTRDDEHKGGLTRALSVFPRLLASPARSSSSSSSNPPWLELELAKAASYRYLECASASDSCADGGGAPGSEFFDIGRDEDSETCHSGPEQRSGPELDADGWPCTMLPCAKCGVLKEGYMTQVYFVWTPQSQEEAQKKPWLSMDTFYPRETKHLGWFVNDCKHLQSHMACSRPCAVTLASILNLPPRNPFLPPLPPCPPAESEEAGSARTLRSGDERHVESGEDESAHSPRSWKSDSDADASSASFGSAHSPSEWSGSECGSCGSSGSAPSSVDEARYTYEAWCSQLEAVMLALTATLARARAGRCSGDDVGSMFSIQASWVRRLMKTKPPEWERRVRRLSWLRMEIEDACGRGPW